MLPKFSCAISGISRMESVFDAVKAVKDAGFDGVDFALSHYAKKEGPLTQAEGWKDWVLAVRDYLEELSLPVVQAHAPWTQDIPADFSYIPPYPVFFRVLEACAMLNCRKLVFHPLLWPYRVESPGLYARVDEYNSRWFRELLPLASDLGIRLEIENLFDYHHVQQPGDPDYLYARGAQLLSLAEQLPSESVGLCLDTGHANITGQDVPEMIRSYGKRLGCLHLNDNYGPLQNQNADLHLFPGEGTLPWPEIYKALREIGYEGSYNLEPIADLKELLPSQRSARLHLALESLKKQLA